MVVIDLIYNLALLVALSVVSGFVDTRWKRTTRLGALLQGLVFGGAATIGMLRPFVLAPGLIFDGRSVMISLGGLFFGPWTAAMACLMTIPLRLVQGGPGAAMGVLVILASAGIGVGFHLRRRQKSREVSAATLVGFGVIVHVAMLAMVVALPWDLALPTLKRIGGPVMLTYPLATVLIGKILSDQAARSGFVESLQESERRFRAIFNSTYQFTGLLTPDGTLTEANQTAMDFGGIKIEEVVRRPFWEAVWWRGNETRVRQLQEAINRAAAGEFVRYEVEMQGAGETSAVVDFSLKPVFDPAGRVTLLIPEGRDITERKRLEQERWTLEAQLRQQQKLESLGTLAGGVAHEINNPINGIMNYAQLIQDRLPTGSPLGEFTGEILRETQRVATIVQNLLTFAREEKRSRSLASMGEIVEGTLSLMRTIIRRDQITLTLKVAADLPCLPCRSQQIQQVLMNLMTNARDALNERYPGYDPDKVLEVSAHLRENSGQGWIRVTVEDHGTGIKPEVRDRIFDPFFTTKPRDKGTGLGLAISHGIVKEHHGALTVETEPGRWTRIHLDLPVDTGQDL